MEWELIWKVHSTVPSHVQTYSFVVYPKWHPRYNDNHEAWNVDGYNEKGQLPRKSQFDPQTTISTWKRKKTFRYSIFFIFKCKLNLKMKLFICRHSKTGCAALFWPQEVADATYYASLLDLHLKIFLQNRNCKSQNGPRLPHSYNSTLTTKSLPEWHTKSIYSVASSICILAYVAPFVTT